MDNHEVPNTASQVKVKRVTFDMKHQILEYEKGSIINSNSTVKKQDKDLKALNSDDINASLPANNPDLNDENANSSSGSLNTDPDFNFIHFISAHDIDVEETKTHKISFSSGDDSDDSDESEKVNLLLDVPASGPNEKRLSSNRIGVKNIKLNKSEEELRLLDRCKFDTYLQILKRKKDKFERIYGEKEKEDYQIALESIEDLQESLCRAKAEFLNSKKSMYLKVRAFRKNCFEAIDEARQTLKEHRGWKKFLTKFVSIILSMCSFFLANLISGRGVFGLFHPKTDSAKKLDKLSFDIKVATHDIMTAPNPFA